jgi:hypothetical protein
LVLRRTATVTAGPAAVQQPEVADGLRSTNAGETVKFQKRYVVGVE